MLIEAHLASVLITTFFGVVFSKVCVYPFEIWTCKAGACLILNIAASEPVGSLKSVRAKKNGTEAETERGEGRE